MAQHSMGRRLAGAAALGGMVAALAVLLPFAASAQGGATPREVPKGFVVPGPAPTNAPAGKGSAPAAAPSQRHAHRLEPLVQSPGAFWRSGTPQTK